VTFPDVQEDRDIRFGHHLTASEHRALDAFFVDARHVVT
jgi:hypothetical protein